MITMVLGVLAKLPGWVYMLIAFIFLGIYIHHHGAQSVQKKWDAEKAAYEIKRQQLIAENEAKIEQAKKENEILLGKQKRTNDRITNEFQQEIANLNTAIDILRGMRLGSSFTCPGDSSETSTQSPSSNNGTSQASGVLSDRGAENFKRLIRDMEHDAAVARACQKFIKENGMSP